MTERLIQLAIAAVVILALWRSGGLNWDMWGVDEDDEDYED